MKGPTTHCQEFTSHISIIVYPFHIWGEGYQHIFHPFK